MRHSEVDVEIRLTNQSKSNYCLGNAGQGCKMTLGVCNVSRDIPPYPAIITDGSPHLRLFFIRLPPQIEPHFRDHGDAKADEDFHFLKMDHGIA